MILRKEDIEQLEQRKRATFVNSLAGYKQAVLVGTKSPDGIPNLAIFNSLIHLGANPALFGLINRPDSVQRDTLQNIIANKEYSLNFVQNKDYTKAHQTSARYDKDVSEFEKVGFTEIYYPNFKAPFVEESVVKIAMKLEDILDIPQNGTKLIIGSIMQVEFDESILKEDGYIALNELDVLLCQGLDSYFEAKPIARLPYAKA